MKWYFNKAVKNEKGATMLEYAFVFPALLMSMIAIIDVARYATVDALVTKAAYDGLNIAT